MRRLFLYCLLLIACCLLVPTDAEAAAMLLRTAGALGGFFLAGPIGGLVGGLVGGFIGGLLFPEKAPTIKGPRLDDKTVQSSAYGSHINKTWGTDRVPAQLIFSSGLIETKHKTEMGGKGMTPTQTSVTYTYSADFMLSFGRRAKGVKRLWADTKLILDTTGASDIKKSWAKQGKKFVVRDGSETQLPSALEESYHGAGQCSAHRGLFCLEAEGFQLANFANRIPNFTAEIYTEGTDSYGIIASYTEPSATVWFGSWGYIDPNGEIWAMYYPSDSRWPYPEYGAKVLHWTLDRPAEPVEEFHPLWSGSGIIQEASVASYLRVRSDEPSAAAYGTNGQGVSLSYFQLEAGTRLDFLDSEVGAGHWGPEILVKYASDFYVHFQFYGGQTTMRFDEFGIKQTQSNVIETTTGQGPLDMGRSETYLWAIVNNGGGVYTLLKLDAATLALVSQATVSGITGDALLAMAVISDTEVRFVTVAGDGTRFYISGDDGVTTLDKYAPDDTYIPPPSSRWGLRFVNDMYVLDFGGGIGGFAAHIDFFAPGAETLDVPLWKIVRDINIMSGLDSVVGSSPPSAGDVVVDELTDMVHGYSITRAVSARDALIQLQQCYFFDCREKDLVLDYPKRGHAPVKSLPSADLAARSSIGEQLPDRLTHTRTRESELPLRVHVIYSNWEASYQSGHEYAPRVITDARATETIQISVAITSVEARRIADTLLALAWLERETFQARVSRKHMRVDAADNVEVVITES